MLKVCWHMLLFSLESSTTILVSLEETLQGLYATMGLFPRSSYGRLIVVSFLLLFPAVCSMLVRVRPPAHVAISSHLLRAYKMEREAWGTRVAEAPILREMAQADGPLTVYLHVPEAEATMWQRLLKAIGYWGQTDSLA